jgi:hypothetical protein
MKKNASSKILIAIGFCLLLGSCKRNECECSVITAQGEQGGKGMSYIPGNKSKARTTCENRSTGADANGDRTVCTLK